MTDEALLARLHAVEEFMDAILNQAIANTPAGNLQSEAVAAWDKMLRAREEAKTGKVAGDNALPAAMAILLVKLHGRL